MQAVPGGGVRVARDDAEHGAPQVGRQRGGIGLERGEAPARLGHHLVVAQRAEDADQAGAQLLGGGGIARTGLPAELLELRRQARARIGAERGLAGIALVEVVDAAQRAGHQLPEVGRAIQRHLGGQVEHVGFRLQADRRQRACVQHQAQLVDHRQAGEAVAECLELRRGVQGAEVALLPVVDQHRTAARQFDAGLAVDQGLGHGAVAAAHRDRHPPAQRRLVRTIHGELALFQRHRRAAVAAGRAGLDQRHAGLQGEIVRHLGELAAGRRAVDLGPQVVGQRIAVGALGDVAAHAGAPCVGADVILQHVDHRRALAVGDSIEGLAGLLHGLHVLDHRAGGRIGVAPHRPAAGVGGVHVVLVPLRMQLAGRAPLHPGGEALVEPQVVPPRHGHQVAEPLVGDLVRRGGEHALLVGDVRGRRVEQQRILEGEDRAPVLHRAEELAAARGGDVVQLGQRVRHAEIVVVFAQHVAAGVQRIPRLPDLAALGDDADLGAVVAGKGGALEIADTEEQQVGRHPRRGLEHRAAQAAGASARAGHRHVADHHVAGRRVHRQVEGRLVVGLVPGRHEAARIRVLELRVQRALLARGRRVVEREQAVRLRVDGAGVVGGQHVAPRRQRRGEGEGRGLRGFVQADPGRHRLAARRRQRAVGEGHAQRLQDDAVGRYQHLEVDLHLAVEGQAVGVRGDLDRVVARHHGARQLSGGAHQRRMRRGAGVGGRGLGVAAQGQGNGDSHQGAAHAESSKEWGRRHGAPGEAGIIRARADLPQTRKSWAAPPQSRWRITAT